MARSPSTCADARALLLSVVGDDPRVREAAGAAELLVRLCGRLPLAVVIAGSILAEDPELGVPELVAELNGAATRLATLQQGASAVGLAFDVSWRRLQLRDPAAAGLLKLLILNPGPSASTEAAAALSGRSPAAVRPLLRALRHARLLQLADGRWQLHDLVRLYVRDREAPRCLSERSAFQTGIALVGQALEAAGQLGDPVRHLETLRSAEREVDALAFLAESLSRTRQHQEALEAVRRAISLARARGDELREGQLLTNLGTVSVSAGLAREAFDALDRATRLCRSSGDQLFEARAWTQLAVMYAQLGRHSSLAEAQGNALRLYRALGDQDGESNLLVNIGTVLSQLGGLSKGVAAYQQAVDVFRAAGDRHAEAEALSRLGVYLAEGLQVSAACTAHRKAADLWEQIGNRHREGVELATLARAYVDAGRPAAARRTAEEAIEALLDSGDPARAAATGEWLGELPETAHVVSNPQDPPSGTTVTEDVRNLDGCYTLLTLIGIPVAHTFGGPWWIFAGWAVLAPLLQRVLVVTFPVEKRSIDLTTAETERTLHAAKGCLSFSFTLFAAATLALGGGTWWLLACCTVPLVLGVSGRPRLVLYGIVGGITVPYTWGTWWAVLGLLLPLMGAVPTVGRLRQGTARSEIGF